MKQKHLADLARTILKDPTVKVTFGGDVSYFTHETDRQGNKIVKINIQKMEATPTGVLMMCGLVFHEIGHMNTTGGKSPGMLGDMENIVEDVRVDQLTIKERPGTAFDLEALEEHFLGKGSLEPKDISDAIKGKAMAYGRARVLNQKCMTALEEACDEMIDDAFGQSFIDEIEDILSGYNTLKDSDGSRKMAKELIDLLIQQQQNQQQQQQQSQSQNQQQNGSGAGGQGQPQPQQGQGGQTQDDQEDDQNQQQGSGQGQDQDQDQDQQDDSGNSGNGGQSTQSDPNGENGASGSEDSSDPSQDSAGSQGLGAGGKGKMPTPEEIEEMLNNQTGYGDIGQLIQDELDQLAEDTSVSPGTPEWPEIGRLTRKYRPLDETECMAASSRMRARLGSLLFSSKRMPVTHGTSGRKLNTNRLVRMMTTGDPKIFSKKVEESAPNSAVVIITDTSYSMETNGRWIVANQAAFAVNSCLHSLPGVSCASLEFSDKDRDDGSYAPVNVVCGFGEKPKNDAFNVVPFNGTPTDQAIWAGRGLLLQRPEPRKILLIVTDGEPNGPEECHAATARTLKDGIEIAAIGVQSTAVELFWKNNRVINTVSDLPVAMFGMMEELLTRRPGSA